MSLLVSSSHQAVYFFLFCPCQETEAAERLRVTRTSLEITNEKLEAELEETKQQLRAALSRPTAEGADRKTWRSSVITRSVGHAPT